MNTTPYIQQIKKELQKHARKYNIPKTKYFFTEPVRSIGITHPNIHRTVNQFHYAHRANLTLADYLSISESLLKTGIYEYGIAACYLVQKHTQNYTQQTFPIFERWLKKYTHNWAHCDALCPSCIGALIQTYSTLIPRVLAWSRSKNRWLRRASCVSFVNISRRSDYTVPILKVAVQLMGEKDDLVQKALGWTLREAAKANKKAIIQFLRKNKSKMPRTTLRYAIERFTPQQKKELMEK